MTTRCDISDKNLTFCCSPNFTVSRCQAEDAAVAVRITQTNVPGKLASKELTLRHYSALNFLCFPSFLLDKVSQPIPYKGHRRRRKEYQEGIEVLYFMYETFTIKHFIFLLSIHFLKFSA